MLGVAERVDFPSDMLSATDTCGTGHGSLLFAREGIARGVPFDWRLLTRRSTIEATARSAAVEGLVGGGMLGGFPAQCECVSPTEGGADAGAMSDGHSEERNWREAKNL